MKKSYVMLTIIATILITLMVTGVIGGRDKGVETSYQMRAICPGSTTNILFMGEGSVQRISKFLQDRPECKFIQKS